MRSDKLPAGPPTLPATSFTPGFKRRFREKLLRWFDRNRRDLPWRRNRDPYRVWISEIMLQQTRAAAVVEHYQRFLKRFPDVQALARARSTSVLAAWSGLGYYRRARLLHQAARQIAPNGFPRDAAAWRLLPGIGRYTAAAIASICLGESCAAVDGNVKRVLTRLSGGRPACYWTAAEGLLSRRRPGDFNQAMMELGATVCVPQDPACARCPVASLCRSAHAAAVKATPPRPARKKSVLAYALLRDGGRVFLVQRSRREAVMPGLWELPPLEAADVAGQAQMVLRHAIMQTDYRVSVVPMAPSDTVAFAGRWFRAKRAAALPLTGLARKILHRSHMI